MNCRVFLFLFRNDFVRLRQTGLLLMVTLLAACSRPVSEDKLFSLLPARHTGVGFANTLSEEEDFNIIEYLYYYNGGGVAAGDINGDGLPDLYFTANQLPDRLYLNKGNFFFEDITEQAGLMDTTATDRRRWKTGVAMADVNGDGWLDIYVCEVGTYKIVEGHNHLYLNNGDGTFSERAKALGLDFGGFSQQAAFFDYDRDGDLDCYLLNHSVHSTASYAPAFNRLQPDSLAGDRFFRNDNGYFTDVTNEAGIFRGAMGYGLGIAVSDLNGDGFPDVYVCNDFHENDYLYLNNGDGSFSESIAVTTGHTSAFSMGADAADLNNDGRTDLLTLDMKPWDEYVLKASTGADAYNLYRGKIEVGFHYQFPHNALQLHIGHEPGLPYLPRFAEVAQQAGVDATDWSWSVLLADFDLDGWKDVFITNGIWRRPNDLDYLRYISNDAVQSRASDLEMAAQMPSGAVPNVAFRNVGKGFIPHFENTSTTWGLDLTGCSNGAACADLDGDGDLDLVVNNLNAPAAIYRNEAVEKGAGQFLKLSLTAAGANSFGIGAKAELFCGGQHQVQELYTVRGWQSSVEPVLVFGTGSAARVDSLRITWPDGSRQVWPDLAVNQSLRLRQQVGTATFRRKPTAAPPLLELFDLPANMTHRENHFVDFDAEPFIPWMLSYEGPRMALADVNGDGLEDLYICGSRGQPGQLWLRTSNSFLRSEQPAFDADAASEDADAVFSDANGDGHADLFVVSGGGELPEGAPHLQDRLYLNDGRGHYRRAPDVLPGLAYNSACAVAADFDGDEDADLFVGSRSVPGSYGIPPRSVFWRNDGSGRFSAATAQWCPTCDTLGMVTDAVWMPQERTLALAGEWMPITFLHFDQGTPAAVTQLATGLWQCLAPADLDGDGDTDLLAGNIGLNTDLRASAAEPLELYAGDLDGNGANDPIITRYRQGRRYPVVSKDELVKRMPVFKKRFVKYSDYASATFEAVFGASLKKVAFHRRVTEMRSCWIENLGNGRFDLHALPSEMQSAPVRTFLTADLTGNGLPDVLAGGNRFEVQPYIGRFDASCGWSLRNDSKGYFTPLLPSESGLFIKGEIADMARLGELILVTRNGRDVLGLRPLRPLK